MNRIKALIKSIKEWISRETFKYFNRTLHNDSESIVSSFVTWYLILIIIVFAQYVISDYQIGQLKKEVIEIQELNMNMIQDLNTSIQTLDNRVSENEATVSSNLDVVQNSLDRLYGVQAETKLLEMQIEMNEVEKLKNTNLKDYYLEYMNLCEKYSDWVDLPESIYDCLTSNEIYYLQRMVETETCGADFASRVHVADVVFNRIEDPRWPNDVISVITQPNQFAYVKTNISEDTRLAVEYAFMFPDETQGALAFHSNAKSDTFGGYNYIFSDSAIHHFFK